MVTHYEVIDGPPLYDHRSICRELGGMMSTDDFAITCPRCIQVLVREHRVEIARLEALLAAPQTEARP